MYAKKQKNGSEGTGGIKKGYIFLFVILFKNLSLKIDKKRNFIKRDWT